MWARYVDLELGSGGSLDAAKQLFGRSLLSCPTVELHQQYLKCVGQVQLPRAEQMVVLGLHTPVFWGEGCSFSSHGLHPSGNRHACSASTTTP